MVIAEARWAVLAGNDEGHMGDGRPQAWLDAALTELWARHFEDVPAVNDVRITYCRPSKTRLGWIALSESGRYTHIGINRLLRHAEVPEDICHITIAHELVHYSHGFGSPLPQRYADPHADAVVERDLIARGLGEPLRRYQEWAELAWGLFYARHAQGKGRSLSLLDRPAGDSAALSSPVAALDVATQRRGGG